MVDRKSLSLAGAVDERWTRMARAALGTFPRPARPRYLAAHAPSSCGQAGEGENRSDRAASGSRVTSHASNRRTRATRLAAGTHEVADAPAPGGSHPHLAASL